MPTFADTGFTVSPQANTASPAALIVCDRPLGYHDLSREMLPKTAALKQPGRMGMAHPTRLSVEGRLRGLTLEEWLLGLSEAELEFLRQLLFQGPPKP